MHIICSDREESLWLQERRKRITASDLGTFMGSNPDWFSGDKESLLEEKRLNTERDFGPNGSNVAHGRFNEDNNLKKASVLFGLPVVPYHFLVGHERWPHLAATLDGLGMVDYLTPPDYSFAKSGTKYGRFDTLPQVLETRAELEQLSGVIIVEMKQTGSHIFKRKGERRSWVEELPKYLIPQLQCQMWLMGIPQCLIVGQLGADNMTGYTVFRDSMWERILDEVNAEAGRFLRGGSIGGVGF